MRAFDVSAGCRARVLAVGLCAQLCAAAHAQAPASDARGVQLSIPDCADVPGAQISKLLVLELNARPLDSTPGSTSASLRCEGSHATITVVDPRRASPLELELELADTKPEARPRFLALTMAELIATSRLERVAPPPAPPPPPPPPPPASPEVPSGVVAEPGARTLEVSLEVGALRGFEPTLAAPTAAIGVTQRFAPFALGADVSFERGQLRTSQADLTGQDVSLRVSPEWHASGELLDLGLALGLRVGYARLAASARATGLVGHALWGVFLAPIARAGLQLRAAPAWAGRLTIEAGYVAKPVRGVDADQATLLELRGLRLAALAGVVWSPQL